MTKINKLVILSIVIIFFGVSCNSEEYNKYLADHKLLEVAKIELIDFTVHVAIKQNEYTKDFMFINDALKLNMLNLGITQNKKILKNMNVGLKSGFIPVFTNGKEFLLDCAELDYSGGDLIIYFSRDKGFKSFLIRNTSLSQLIYYKDMIYTTWDKSVEYLEIINVASGKVVIPKTTPLFYGDLFIIKNKLFAVNYDYKKRKYTEIYEIKGTELMPYEGERFEIPKKRQLTLDDFLINRPGQ